MAAKDIKNLIMTLIITLIGMQLIAAMAKNYIPKDTQIVPKDILLSIDSITNSVTIALIIIVIILVPYYLSKKSEGRNDPFKKFLVMMR